MDRGRLITIEGIHGSGKSTISRLLVEKMKEQGLDVTLTIDQVGTDLGRKIRQINLGGEDRIDFLVEALLIAAARRQNIAEVIKPNLLEGRIVVCERYSDAYFAFQGAARALSTKFLECVSSTISEGIRPDLTILLDLEVHMALARLEPSAMHRVEKEPHEFHSKVREGYLMQARKFSNRISVVDAGQSKDKVFREAWEMVENLLAPWRWFNC